MKTSLHIDSSRKNKSVANNLSTSTILQAKLKIGKPDDKYEQEAEQTANRVMMMPETSIISRKCESCSEEENVQTKPLFSSTLPTIQRIEKEEEHVQPKIDIQKQNEEEEENIQPKLLIQRQPEEEEEPIQAKLFLQKRENNGKPVPQSKTEPTDVTGPSSRNSFESTLSSKRGNGSPLPDSTKNFMENRIGADFSGVRVHHDEASANLSNQINAQAFTTGKDIFFNKGKYNPDSSSGKHLLAHELTHVVQQGSLQRKNQLLKKASSVGNNIIQRGILGDIVGGVSTIVTQVGRVIGGGITTATNWINSISNFIGGGITQAWQWINQVASTIGLGVGAAWAWIRNFASQIGMGIRTAMQWIINIARVIGAGVQAAWQFLQRLANTVGRSITSAWEWIRNIASTIGMGIRLAWSWVQAMAQRVGFGILAAWNWVRSMAAELRRGIRRAFEWLVSAAFLIGLNSVVAAWNWLRRLAALVRGTILFAWTFILNVVATLRMGFEQALAFLINLAISIGVGLIMRAWNWIKNVARQIGQRVQQAWQWIQNIARRIARSIMSAWNYLKSLARKFKATINRVWWWLQSFLPLIIIGHFRNSGSTSANNLCTLCPQTLGPSTTDGTNGMELRGDIIGHNPLFTYDFKRTKERATWKKVGTTWTQLTHVGPGADDDSHNQDEDLLPDGNKIFVIDTPGFTNKNNPVGDNTASEAVYKASFVETAKALKPGSSWKTVSNSFNWHSVSWFEKHAGSWRRKAGSSEIDTGSTTVGTGDP